MDFDEFEQLVLKVLFETDVPLTAAHVAYLGRISVRTSERHLARMIPDPLDERVEPIQARVASHPDVVRPDEVPGKPELSREQRTQPLNHKAARGDAQDVVDVGGRQRHGVECVADGPRSDVERSVPELGVQVGRGFGEQASCAHVFRRQIQMPLLDMRRTEQLFHDPVLQAEECPDLFL